MIDRRFVVLASTTILLLPLEALANPQSHQSRTRNCVPIGRIMSDGDRTLKKGSLLCKGDRLNPGEGKTVKVLCYQNQKVLRLGDGAPDDSPSKCVSKILFERCTPQDRSNCPVPKNPGSDEPTIIFPHSSVIINPRPSISWLPVEGATGYIVKLEGEGVRWSKQVGDNTLAYPPHLSALAVGTTSKLTVVALQGDSPVSASSQAVNMLSSSVAQQVKATVSQIKKLNLSPDEQARDLDSVYMSQNLLTEAIEVLKARVNEGTTNPTLHRLLGDRYLEAGLPLDAKQAYTSASTLASRADNSAELAKAQVGLERSRLAQQP